MALITCPECGKQISDKADACVGCGYPIRKNKNTDDDDEIIEYPKWLLEAENSLKTIDDIVNCNNMKKDNILSNIHFPIGFYL